MYNELMSFKEDKKKNQNNILLKLGRRNYIYLIMSTSGNNRDLKIYRIVMRELDFMQERK